MGNGHRRYHCPTNLRSVCVYVYLYRFSVVYIPCTSSDIFLLLIYRIFTSSKTSQPNQTQNVNSTRECQIVHQGVCQKNAMEDAIERNNFQQLFNFVNARMTPIKRFLILIKGMAKEARMVVFSQLIGIVMTNEHTYNKLKQHSFVDALNTESVH